MDQMVLILYVKFVENIIKITSNSKFLLFFSSLDEKGEMKEEKKCFFLKIYIHEMIKRKSKKGNYQKFFCYGFYFILLNLIFGGFFQFHDLRSEFFQFHKSIRFFGW